MDWKSDGEYTDADVDDALRRNDPTELLYVPIAVSMSDPDFDHATEICLRLATHDDPVVRGNAVLGFGHIARRFLLIDKRAAVVINAALSDPHAHVRGHAASANDDVKHFVK